ncbi:conserved Plasmodium protein, unknown function [Plasmodium malariae]|uniref:Poly(A) RNA polymerase mitochondrial-like central palm domain-containing protein n=1 Tax=Plasmodium malariae TaxID=5858 RepID=A0A1C3KYA6_PLAMA|nr:conserved Plasmodium protein, unknown function [Plasmodium malariae]
MNVKKFSVLSYIWRRKQKLHISNFYESINNFQIFNFPFYKKNNFFIPYSTYVEKNIVRNRASEIDKGIQLTNAKVTDSVCSYISSDDSDDEVEAEEKEVKEKREEIGETVGKVYPEISSNTNRVHDEKASSYDRCELKNSTHIAIHKNSNRKIPSSYDKYVDYLSYNNNLVEAKNNDIVTTKCTTNYVDLHGNKKTNEERNNTISVCKNMHSSYSNDFSYSNNYSSMMKGSNVNGDSKSKDYTEMKYYLNSYINKKEKVYNPNKPNKVNSLSEELKKLEISLRPLQNDINNVKLFLNFLQNEINKHYKNCHVTPFGSIINGLWTKNSDIDICIQIPVLLNRKDQVKFLKKICLILDSFNNGIIEQRFSAKVPIIHFYCKCYKNSFELSFDISINNILAVINSKLIQKYVSIDKRLQIMGIALKYWSKNRNINDRSKGFLSSFSLILMLIHFLQYVVEPKILPSLQDISFKRNEKPFYVMGVDCKFCQDEAVIREELKRMNNCNSYSSYDNCASDRYSYSGSNSNNKNNSCNDFDVDISTLLIEFFKFYGYKYKSGIIAIRDINDYYQNFQALKNYESYFLFVDNPFEVGKDVANVLPQNYKTIVNEMKRAYKILKNNGSWKDVCSSSDNLIYS